MGNIGERVKGIETAFAIEMKAINERLDEIRDLITERFKKNDEEHKALKEKVELLDRNTIQLGGKKGWVILGMVIVLLVLSVLNFVDGELATKVLAAIL